MTTPDDARRRIGRQIVDGYLLRTPQTDDEVREAARWAISSIEEEPWLLPRGHEDEAGGAETPSA